MINIKIRARNLHRKYGTRNPEIIANEMGIIILKRPYSSTKTKGFFKKELGNKFIVVNSNLSQLDQLIVIAHELGHAILHDSKVALYLHEYSLFPRGKVEVEANKFAAELLINEQDLDKHSMENMTQEQIASYYGVPLELVKYKFS